MRENLGKQQPSKVANPIKTGKYLTIIVMVILVVILSRGFFAESYKANKKADIIKPAADNLANNLNLDLSPAEYVAALPVLPTKFIPPPPSVLPSPDLESGRMDQTRIKSPTMVYDAEKEGKIESSTHSQNALGNDANGAFSQQIANTPVVTVTAKHDRNTDYKILQGKLIAAVLETSISSDLPGMVRGVISKDVYSDTGRVVLLPKGTRLIGQYNATLSVGQTRIMIVWTRAITPQHVDIALGSPNTDQLGQAGMDGNVDTHFWKIFGTSALLSVLGVMASSATVKNSNSDSGNTYQNAVSQGVLNTSNSVLQSRVNIQPTIRVAQGSAIDVFVARDLDFSAVHRSGG